LALHQHGQFAAHARFQQRNALTFQTHDFSKSDRTPDAFSLARNFAGKEKEPEPRSREMCDYLFGAFAMNFQVDYQCE
jgi:hypothetical protein